MKKIIIICLIVLIVSLIGCSSSTSNFSVEAEVICNEVCLNEKMSLNHVTGTSDTLYCHCEKIIEYNT